VPQVLVQVPGLVQEWEPGLEPVPEQAQEPELVPELV